MTQDSLLEKARGLRREQKLKDAITIYEDIRRGGLYE